MEQKIDEIFARGTVVEVLPSKDDFKKRLLAGPIRIYIGVDPNYEALHLGHAKNIMFLEELRQLGHEVILLFGDFTAQIGDPDKKSTRPQLTPEQTTANAQKWLAQVKPILNFEDAKNPAKIMYNSTWLSKLTFADVTRLASNFTVQQFIERDLFEKRLKEGSPIHLHEFMYPLMQGYDSVAMDVDAELCGTDQIFNALAGRTLQKRLNNKEKFVVALNLVANPKTGELMSKSKGTGVFINLPPNELFGAIMATPDPMIEPLYINCTRLDMNELPTLLAGNPRDAKVKIAYDIVRRFHGEDSAKSAEQSFSETFSKGVVPENIPELRVEAGKTLVDALIAAQIVESKTEWRRLVTDGAVRLEDDSKITDPFFAPTATTILKVGKRRFVKILV